MEKEENVDQSFRKKIIGLIVVGIAICVTAGIAVSYAFFSVSVNENNSNDTVVTTGNMEVTYIGGNDITSLDNMIPGQSVTKTFTVRNTGTLDTEYSIYLNDVVNNFANMDDLVFTLTSTGGGTTINQTVYPDSNKRIAANIPIAYQGEHVYTLTITFKETGENQDSNQGKVFSGSISLEPKTSSTITLYRTIYDKPDPIYQGNQITDSSTYYLNAQTLVSKTGKKYMLKEINTANYIEAGITYGVKVYDDITADFENPDGYHGYDTIEECEEDLDSHGDHTISKSQCYLKDGKYFISYFLVNNSGYEPVAVTYYDHNQCLSDVAMGNQQIAVENFYHCEEYGSDSVGELILDDNNSSTTYELCIYENNTLDCIDKSEGWDAPSDDITPQEMTTFMSNHPNLNCYDNGWGNMNCNYNNEVSVEYNSYIKEFKATGYYISYSRKYNNEQFNNYDDCETYISNSNLSDVICDPDYIDNKIALYHYRLSEFTDPYDTRHRNNYFSESELNLCTQNNTYSCGISRLDPDDLKCYISDSNNDCGFSGSEA